MHQVPEERALAVSQFEKEPCDVLIDTDIGDDIDDALALVVALHSPEIKVRAITTVSGDTSLRARLAAHLLHVYGREDIPIAAGMEVPLQFRHRARGVPQAEVVERNASYGAIRQMTGPELIIETAGNCANGITLVCIGQMTNVATALVTEPNVRLAIRRIVMMGGSSGVPLPEWNVRSDAKAASIVLESGIPVTIVGLNITMRCQMRASDVALLKRNDAEQTHLLSRLLDIWREHRPRWQPRLPYLHDPLTMAVLCRPELFRFSEMTARVLTRGPLQGFMVPRWMKGPMVKVVTGIEVEEAREWVMQRLLASSHSEVS